jgi:type I restriction enzyme M protein
MVTGELKSPVDKIWETFWTGGISNPLTVIEQFTFLLFLRRLDENQLRDEKRSHLLGTKSRHSTHLNRSASGGIHL